MAASLANEAKGQWVTWAKDVADDGTPATFDVVLLVGTVQSIDDLRAHKTLQALIAANTECGVASYLRLVLADTEVDDPVVSDATDDVSLDVGDFDFGTLESGETVGASVIAYNAAGNGNEGSDADLIPFHISRPDTPQATNGEIFRWRTPNGLITSREPD